MSQRAEALADYVAQLLKENAALRGRLERGEGMTNEARQQAIAALKSAQAAIWDKHYGRGLSVGYARAASEEIDAALRSLEAEQPTGEPCECPVRNAMEDLRDALPEKCSCHEAYTSRKLRDPDCLYCDNKHEIQAAEAALQHPCPSQDSAELLKWVDHATAFQFGGKDPNMACRVEDLPIRIEARDQRDGTRKWAVLQGGNCLRKDGEWELEMQPSSRSDEFLAMTRYASKEEAHAAHERLKERVK